MVLREDVEHAGPRDAGDVGGVRGPRQARAGQLSNEPQPAAGKIGIRNTNSRIADAGDDEIGHGDADRGQRHQRDVGNRPAARRPR